MIQIVLILLILLWKKIPLTGFQTLLLICLLEVKTGVSVTGYYYTTMLFFYLLIQWSWYSTLKGGQIKCQ